MHITPIQSPFLWVTQLPLLFKWLFQARCGLIFTILIIKAIKSLLMYIWEAQSPMITIVAAQTNGVSTFLADRTNGWYYILVKFR